jgi:hypothetical protein
MVCLGGAFYMIIRSILLALSFRVKKVKKYVAYYLPVAERILCLISGFSRKNHFAPFKALLPPSTPKFNFFALGKRYQALKLETT